MAVLGRCFQSPKSQNDGCYQGARTRENPWLSHSFVFGTSTPPPRFFQCQGAGRGPWRVATGPLPNPLTLKNSPAGVSPMSPDKSVTQVPGCTEYASDGVGCGDGGE
ncbi:MAG: hypothetical protein ACI89E_000594 [Planctomycetota bacterium]|jgi:hypothetical protein